MRILVLAIPMLAAFGCGLPRVPFQKAHRIEIRQNFKLSDAPLMETIVISDKDERETIVNSIRVKSVRKNEWMMETSYTVVFFDEQNRIIAEGDFLSSTGFHVTKSDSYRVGVYLLDSKEFAELIAKRISKVSNRPFEFGDYLPGERP